MVRLDVDLEDCRVRAIGHAVHERYIPPGASGFSRDRWMPECAAGHDVPATEWDSASETDSTRSLQHADGLLLPAERREAIAGNPIHAEPRYRFSGRDCV